PNLRFWRPPLYQLELHPYVSLSARSTRAKESKRPRRTIPWHKEALGLNLPFFVRGVLSTEAAVLRQLQLFRVGLLVLLRRVVPALALGTRKADRLLHRFTPGSR